VVELAAHSTHVSLALELVELETHSDHVSLGLAVTVNVDVVV